MKLVPETLLSSLEVHLIIILKFVYSRNCKPNNN